MRLLEVVPLRSGGWIRWIARILALLIALFVSAMVWLIVAFSNTTGEENDLVTFVDAVAGAWVVVSLLLGWRWERLGGLSCVLAGVTNYVVTLNGTWFGESALEIVLALIMGVPPVFIGVAFLVADRGVRIARREGGA